MKPIRLLLALSVLALPLTAGAQSRPSPRRILDEVDLIPQGGPTSGSLNTQAAQNWSTAPWMISGGPGAFPTGGGVATFLAQINTILATPPNVAIITIDLPITLSGMTFDSAYQYQINGGTNLSLTTTGANTFNVIRSNQSSLSLFAAGHLVGGIGGGGTFGLTKTGSGILTLTGTNTYTGGTHINAGVLRITGGDAGLGATGAGNDVDINNAALRVSTAALTTARNFALSGNAVIELFANATINGIVSGGGNLIHDIGSTLTLSNTNTYTGSTRQEAGILALTTATGSIATSSAYDFAGTLTLNNTAANNNNRISDTAAITSRGMTFTLTGNAAAATAEAAGALNLASGNTVITLTPDAAQSASLGFASINRQNRSTMFMRGTNLGGTPGAGVAQITSVASPGTLIGGGGAAGSTNISILPWAVGNTLATATAGSSFVTWSGGAFRPLATAEYAAAFGGAATDNVRITATTAAPATTVNALLFAPAAISTLSGGPISITSGAFLYSPTVTATGTVSAGLDFGAAEGLIHTSATLNLSGVISGSNGVTYNGYAGSVITVTGANTYTGATQINHGRLVISGGTIDPSTAGPLGQTNAPIILNIGSATTQLWVNADSTINKNMIVQGTPNNLFTAGFGSTGNFNITMNGNIDLQRRLTIENGSLPFTINGIISGAGGLTDAFSSLVVLNGNNTYSGGTEINAGTYELGSDTGFGTGTVYIAAATGTIRGAGTTPRTIANNFLFNGTNTTFGGSAPLNLTGTIDLNGTGSRTITTTNAATTTFSGLVTNGGLIKAGAGQLSLSSVTGNTYTGGTQVAAGILNVNNTTGSGTGAGTVSVLAAGTLSGNFSISGATMVSGTLAPGNSVGTANFGSSLTLGATAITQLELGSAASFDRINVAGLLTLDGTINLVTIGGYIIQQGDTFDFLNWGSVNAAGFNPATDINFSGAQTAPGLTFDTSNFLIDGSITAIPEPSTYALLASALVFGFAAYRRRRARNS